MIWHPLDGFNGLYLYALVSICTRVVCHCVGTCIILIECHLTSNLSLKPRQPFNSSSQAQPTSRLSPFMWLWHVSRTCVASQSHMRNVRMTNDASHSQMWLVYLGQMHSYVRHDPFKCGVWFVYMCEYVLGCVQNQKDPRSKSINGTMYTHINGHIHICIDVYQIKDPSRSTAISRLGFFRNGHSDLFI